MQYRDSVVQSQQYLRLAIEYMGKLKVATDPINYSIWYEYASGKNEGLNSEIDTRLEKSESFSYETTKNLFDQYIATPEQKVSTIVRKELKNLVLNLTDSIKVTNEKFSNSESNLGQISAAMDPANYESEHQEIINIIRGEISTLETSSADFKHKLKKASNEIDELKTKMAQYREEALKDPLTQIANRRGFDESIGAEIKQANIAGAPLCLIIADIDHFKRVNDTHGHLVGDHVIRITAAGIKNSIKGQDTVARIGGEEFAIILPDTPYNGAMALAENLRKSFDKLDFSKRRTGESLGKITLSFGVTMYCPGESKEDFIDRADAALYNSKRTGRNRVCGIEQPHENVTLESASC